MRKHARRRSGSYRRFIVCAWLRLRPTSVSVFDDEKRPFREDFDRKCAFIPPSPSYIILHTKAAVEILELVSLSFRVCVCVRVRVCLCASVNYYNILLIFISYRRRRRCWRWWWSMRAKRFPSNSITL